MDVDTTIKTIQSLYKTLSGKADGDVSLTYKGNGYGVTKPWIARVDARESVHESYDGALGGLLNLLKKELADKIKSTELEVSRLRQIHNQLGN